MAAASPLSYCLALLKRRLHSRYELDQAMRRRGVDEPERQAVLAELAEVGLLDDQRFAWAWIHDRDRFRPRGASLLRAELMQKGIEASLIDQVLAERAAQAVEPEEEQPDEESLARQVLAGKERLYAGLDRETRQRRATALLERRGFSYEVIRRILSS